MTAPGVRTLIAIVGVVVLLGGLGAVKAAQVATLMAFGRQQAEQGPPPEAVGSRTAIEESWEAKIDAVGSIASQRGVQISAEEPGIVSRIAFESGDVVNRGDVLLELDTSVEQAQLSSARANLELAQTSARRVQSLVPLGAAAEEELDQTTATLRGAQAEVAALRAQIARKTVRAPFAGRLGIRAVDLGQYLAPGTAITELQTTETLFIDFTLPQDHLADLSPGMRVRVAPGRTPDPEHPGQLGPPEIIEASITAIEPAVDPSTRAVRVRAVIDEADERAPLLRAGMFADVEVVLPRVETFVTIPMTAVVHAPYGDSVFIIEDKPADDPGIRHLPDGTPVQIVRQQFVRTGPRRGDFVAILEGVEPGEEVVAAGAFKLRNGTPVFISQVAVPEPRRDPQPQNR